MPLQPGEVKTEHIASAAVTTPKIANNSITGEKIATAQITVDKLSSGAVTAPKIATGAVTADKLPDGVVTTAKLQKGAVTGPKIGDLQVNTSKLRDKAVTTPKIADGAVTLAKLSFTPPAIARPIAPPLTSVELGTNSVETAKIKDGAVTPAKLSFVPTARPLVPPVTTAEIGDGQVTPAKLSFTPTAVGLYVPRDCGGIDFDNDAFPVTEDWAIDGLDLSAIVPAGAKAVHLYIWVRSTTLAGDALIIRSNATTKAMNRATVVVPVAGQFAYIDAIINIDADRMLDYLKYSGLEYVRVNVLGWII
jgi:hypothetical protein